MKLYHAPGSCSLCPHIVLRESELPFQLEKVDLGTKKTEKGLDFLTIAPKGMVPALELENGYVLTEGPAIVQFVADLAPHKNLVPPHDSFQRYQVQEWLNYISTELHKIISVTFKNRANAGAKESLNSLLTTRLDFIQTQLQEKPYLVGSDFTIADAYLFVELNSVRYAQMTLANWPVLRAYISRLSQRPAVLAAIQVEQH